MVIKIIEQLDKGIQSLIPVEEEFSRHYKQNSDALIASAASNDQRIDQKRA
jgi:hypothetical protein